MSLSVSLTPCVVVLGSLLPCLGVNWGLGFLVFDIRFVRNSLIFYIRKAVNCMIINKTNPLASLRSMQAAARRPHYCCWYSYIFNLRDTGMMEGEKMSNGICIFNLAR